MFGGVYRRLYSVGDYIMKMRRCQAMELARYYQRLENIEKRKIENERHVKISFVVRLLRRLGIIRRVRNGSL